jgi:hypothetical protein
VHSPSRFGIHSSYRAARARFFDYGLFYANICENALLRMRTGKGAHDGH